ncbi:MAG TPA: HPP family protein [Polyangiaceae bacterium]|nr:HPP family protein [Polyangiaceae bacterium]
MSAIGGCVAIAAVLSVSEYFVGAGAAGLLVASMGASAVLLFSSPHGPLSQPWPMLGGHLVSGAVGVACARFIETRSLAAALAVGLSIALMLMLRCVHPPGGATALSAVIGSQSVKALGFTYLLTPVLLNAVITLGVAVAFNGLFGWRRYPAYLAARLDRTPGDAPGDSRVQA